MVKIKRILIADDHAIFRHGLKDILAKHFAGVTIREVETAQSAVEQVRKADWNIVVLDITMPGRSGLDVLQEMKRARPALPILILSMHPEEQYAVRVIKAGAAGYVTKIKAPLEIVKAVKRVLAGDNYVSPSLAGGIGVLSKSAEGMLPHEKLSNREFQILRLAPSGKSQKEIAAELSISSQTLSTYRARVMKKLGLHTSAELIRYALENDLAD